MVNQWATDHANDTTKDGDWKRDQNEVAPYPREWTSQQRISAYWYAQRHRIRVDYRPDDDDEGARAWYAVEHNMARDHDSSRDRRQSIRAGVAGDELALQPPEADPHHVPDPGEPRHPRDEIDGW